MFGPQKCWWQFPAAQSFFSNCIFCPANSPKPKDPSVTILNKKESGKFIHLGILNRQIFGIFSWRWLLITKKKSVLQKLIIPMKLYNSIVGQSNRDMILSLHLCG